MEETEEYPNLEELCRLCIGKQNDASSIDIFDIKMNKSVSIPMRIMSCAALEVQSNDGLPKLICTNCRYELEKSYYFRKRCQAADAKLRKHIRLLNLGKKSRVFVKTNDDYDDEELEFEESIQLIKAHEEKIQNDWKIAIEIIKDKELQDYKQDLLKKVKEGLFAEARKSWKTSLRTEIENELRDSVRDDVRNELRDSVRDDVRNELRDSVRDDVRNELRDSVNEELKAANEIELKRFKEECRESEINRLFMDLEEFLRWKTQKHDLSNKKLHKTTKNVDFLKNDETSTSLLRVTRSRTSAGVSLLLPQKVSTSTHQILDYVDATDNAMESQENLSDIEKVDGEENFVFVEETLEDGSNEAVTQTETDENTEIIYKNSSNNCRTDEVNSDFHKKTFKVENCKSNDGDIMIFSYSENDENDDDDNTDNNQEIQEEELDEVETAIEDDMEFIDLNENNSIAQNKSKTQIESIEDTEENKLTNVSPVKLKGNDIISFPQTSDTPKSYACDLCPITFSTKNQLNRHQKNHKRMELKGVSYQCQHCNIYFSCRSSLLRHQVIHTGERPFICEICNKSFIQREILKRHMNIHSKLRPYTCQHCERSFAQKVNLQQHINTNHLKVPAVQLHSCHLCTKRFNHASGLSRHLASHAGVMYQCSECTRTFIDRSSIKRHINNVHGRNIDDADYSKIESNKMQTT